MPPAAGVYSLILAVFAALWTQPCEAKRDYDMHKMRVEPDEHWILDRHGRVRFFHGVNIVKKGFPWYHDYLLNDTRLDEYEKFGLNIVRLGTMWTGVEPEDGEFNSTYVEILRDTVRRLGERGVYSLLDMHQDTLVGYALYDGVPPWVVDAFPEPTNPHPWPLDEITAWPQHYLTQAVSEHFQCLYNNTGGMLERWADFWAHVAGELGGEPAVVGYDYMNEPWVGDFYGDPDLLLPGRACRQNLQPSYDVITERVRAVDEETLVFYEPITYGVLLDRPLLGSGFTKVPGGRQYRDRSVYSWHAYCWAMDLTPPDAPDANKTAAVRACVDTLLPQIFNTTGDTVERVGGGSMLTEFGLCKTADQPGINIDCDVYMNMADEILESWVEWDHNDNKWFNPDGSRRWDKIKPYVRTYAWAVAGVPTYMYFDNDSLDFELEYFADPSISEPTDIFVPSLRYTSGFSVSASPGLEYEASGDDHLLVTYMGEEPASVSVSITANV